MIKLVDLLKEITEAKQVGDLYHFTPLSNLKTILSTRYLYSNEEGQLSTSIRGNMDINVLNKLKNVPVARFMLDGNKISNKYKIRPFAYLGDFNDIDPNDIEDLGEEQIVVNDDKFYFTPYLKRIDIFLNKKEEVDPKILGLLEKANIPYKVYQGTPMSNIPYNQPKTGDPKDIDIEKIPEKKIYTKEEMYYPNMKTTYIKVYANPSSLEYSKNNPDKGLLAGISPEYPDYYIISHNSKSTPFREWVNINGKKLNVKYIPNPEFNNPEWRAKWKKVAPPDNYFIESMTDDEYVLIPKNEVV